MRDYRAIFVARHTMRVNKGRIFNDYHSERHEGEIFLLNMTEAEYAGVEFESKRIGVMAYTNNEELYEKVYGIKNQRPVFVQARELDRLGIEYLWPLPPLVPVR
jgi:hypothetical protein